jgi:hypothetical protein
VTSLASYLALAILLASRVAAAEPGLTWTAPADCPDAADERLRIEQRLGRSLDAVELAGTVTIEPVAYGFAATLALGHDGARHLTGASCDELADAVAVIVARAARDRPAPAHAAVVEPAVEPVVEPAVEQAPELPRPAAWWFGARLSTLGGRGVVPGTGFGGELVATARRGPLIAELGGARWLAGTAAVDGAAVRVTFAAATARLGWQPATPLRAWLVTELGTMSGTGMTRGGASAWFGAGLGAGGIWRLTRTIGIVATVEAIAALDRARFVLTSGTAVYEASPVSTRASLGIELAW